MNKKLKYFGVTAVLVCACAFMYSKTSVKDNSNKDYSFKIKNVDIGTKDVYVEFQVGDDVDEADSVIDDLVLTSGEDQILLSAASVHKTDKKNTYIENYYVPYSAVDEDEDEIYSKIKKLDGKKIDVSGKLHINDANDKKITDKKICDVNLLDEKIIDVNENFTIDDETVTLKKVIIDKYYMSCIVEGNEGKDDELMLFDIKDDSNNNIEFLGGDNERMLYKPKNEAKTITVAAFTKENPLSDDSKRINITLN